MLTRSDTPPTIELTCPTCGAEGQAGAECRRCRSDLRLLQRLEMERAAELPTLAAALAEHRWADALASAQYIRQLRDDSESVRLVAVCQLLNGDITAAFAICRKAH